MLSEFMSFVNDYRNVSNNNHCNVYVRLSSIILLYLNVCNSIRSPNITFICGNKPKKSVQKMLKFCAYKTETSVRL